MNPETPGFDAVDSFAGPGGWDTAAAMLGIRTVGIEKDEQACRTAVAAGHARIRADVSALYLPPFAHIPGHISSPPCQAWSKSGKRLGLIDQPKLVHIVNAVRAKIRRGSLELVDIADWMRVKIRTNVWADPRSPLVLEPLRYVLTCEPRWVALEQVPDVLPFWYQLASVFRELGYRTAVGVLSAERYGVPQTRKRAILTASLDHAVSLSPATHHAFDPYDSGDVVESLFEVDLMPWVSMADALGWGLPDRPSWTVSAGGTESGGAEVFANAASRRRLAAYSRIETNNESRTANGPVRFSRPIESPSPTLTSSTRSWVWRRPATTVQCDPRIAEPGHRDREGGVSQFDGDSVQVSIEEAARLQSFPDDYPWHGNKGKRYEQIGNAIPVLLAVAVLGHLHGIAGWRDICRDAFAPKLREAL